MLRTAAILMSLSVPSLPGVHVVTESRVQAATISECHELLRTGEYQKCLAATAAAIADRSYGEEWPLLKTRCELALGLYPEAAATIKVGLERYSWSVRLAFLEHQVALANGQPEQAAAALQKVASLASTAAWRYTDAGDLVALGQAALAAGGDPKTVQESFFERARRNYGNRPDGFLAAGQLAVTKGDFRLAADILQPASRDFPQNPEILFSLAESLWTADKPAAVELLRKTLQINPAFEPALTRLAEEQIDAEDYEAAGSTLARVFSTNPHSPDAHALQAVIHHLQHNLQAADDSQAAAVRFSVRSPRVDYLIGRKLSQKYRFTEGAAFQKKALETDPLYQNASIQLAQDLLRLGEDVAGWQAAATAHQGDGYHVTLFNLLQLKDRLDNFATLRSDRFQLRMEKREAAIYGSQAMQLLENAFSELVSRYQFTPTGPVIVEIFPRAEDFAVRTFGVPDVSGFLGVCFGRVITANSPASRREHPSSWESVLWHEFCHVITLQMTNNRIPRWLSEGISVYEERRRDARWGQRMTPEFRDRIRRAEITPVSQLSSAFLTADGGDELNFAYFESSMVVAYLVEEFGHDALLRVLGDLRDGISINDALSRHTTGMPEFEAAFATYLAHQAELFAPTARFDEELLGKLTPADTGQLAAFVKEHPDHFTAGLSLATRQIADGQDAQAESILRHLMTLVPDDVSPAGPRRLLAEICQRRGDCDGEMSLLRDHMLRSADDLPAAVRLQQLEFDNNRLSETVRLGWVIRGIDPFQPEPTSRMAAAAERTGDVRSAAAALECLLQLQPDDAARLHFRLAELFENPDRAAARKHVLLSLQLAPRYRAAHRLLLALQPAEASDTTPSAEAPPGPEVSPAP